MLASNDILSNPANFTLLIQTSLHRQTRRLISRAT